MGTSFRSLGINGLVDLWICRKGVGLTSDLGFMGNIPPAYLDRYSTWRLKALPTLVNAISNYLITPSEIVRPSR